MKYPNAVFLKVDVDKCQVIWSSRVLHEVEQCLVSVHVVLFDTLLDASVIVFIHSSRRLPLRME